MKKGPPKKVHGDWMIADDGNHVWRHADKRDGDHVEVLVWSKENGVQMHLPWVKCGAQVLPFDGAEREPGKARRLAVEAYRTQITYLTSLEKR